MTLDRDERTATVVLTAPTPGWRVGVDRIDEGFHRRDIFLTIQPPDPTIPYSQVTVEQRVATNVVADVAARLFARTTSPGRTNGNDGPYSKVLVSDPKQLDTATPADPDSRSTSDSN